MNLLSPLDLGKVARLMSKKNVTKKDMKGGEIRNGKVTITSGLNNSVDDTQRTSRKDRFGGNS